MLLLSGIQATALAATSCTRPTLEHFQELLDNGRRQILVIEYSDARLQLEEAVLCLSRLDGVVPDAALGRLFMDLGVARLQLGDERGAADAFRRASVMAPSVRWEPRLGAKAMGSYLSVKEDVLLLPRRNLRFPALMPDAHAALDGIPIDPSGEISLFAGLHLLQVQESAADPWVGQFLEIPEDDTIPP
jgi:hypothetical protein